MRSSPFSLLPSPCSSRLAPSSSVPVSQFGRYRPLYSSRLGPLTAFPPPNPVPSSILKPHYVPPEFWSLHDGGQPIVAPPTPKGGKIILGGPEEHGIRAAARLAKEVLTEAGRLVKVRASRGRKGGKETVELTKFPPLRLWLKPGITTAEIDRFLHGLIISRGAYPSPLGYSNFPKSVCTSINNVRSLRLLLVAAARS